MIDHSQLQAGGTHKENYNSDQLKAEGFSHLYCLHKKHIETSDVLNGLTENVDYKIKNCAIGGKLDIWAKERLPNSD